MSLATPPAPPTLLPPSQCPAAPIRAGATPRWARLVVPTAVLLAALGAAAFAYGHFLQVGRHLWDSASHDRNAHYDFALQMASDLRLGRVIEFITELDSARMWPPLHGVLAAGVLLAAGPDYRWAVLPSLAGWVAAVFFACLSARRAVRRGRDLAGLVAALFVLVSPAYRAYATDVMLESLGAGLSMAALYCYLATVQGRGAAPWPARCLGLVLTLLFLHKYNYWTLVVVALTGATLAALPHAWWAAAGNAVRRFPWRSAVLREVRQPLNYLWAAPLALTVAVLLRGPQTFVVGAWSVSLYPPYTILNIAYALFFLRVLLWWRRGGREWAGRLDGGVRPLVRWHLLPVAVWFLLPKRLGYFLLFISPANAGASQKFDLVGGAGLYMRWILTEYHTGLPSLIAALALLGVAVLTCRRLRPGGQAVLWLTVLSFALTVLHPNHKARCLHSWLPALWASAGVGAAGLVYGRWTVRVKAMRGWLAGAGVVGLLLAQGPAAMQGAHAEEGGPHPQRPSVLELSDYYLPELDHAKQADVLADAPIRFLAEWTFLERYGRLDRLENNWLGFADRGKDERKAFERWLGTTRTDVLVVIERTPGTDGGWEDGDERVRFAQIHDLLLEQRTFRKEKSRDFPDLFCTVSVWRRTAP